MYLMRYIMRWKNNEYLHKLVVREVYVKFYRTFLNRS